MDNSYVIMLRNPLLLLGRGRLYAQSFNHDHFFWESASRVLWHPTNTVAGGAKGTFNDVRQQRTLSSARRPFEKRETVRKSFE